MGLTLAQRADLDARLTTVRRSDKEWRACARKTAASYAGVLEDLAEAGVRFSGGHRHGRRWVDAPGQPTSRSLGFWVDNKPSEEQRHATARAMRRAAEIIRSDSSFVPSRDDPLPLAA